MANTQAKPDLRAVTIAIVRKGAEAERIQKKLKSEGIESFLASERSFAINKSGSKELGAVKVQVGGSDVQRALRILGAANLAASPNSGTGVKGRKARNPITRLVEKLDPRLQPIVVIAVIIAALILFLF